MEHPDGRTGTIHLEEFYLNDDERTMRAAAKDSSEHCRFTGYLAADPEGSCVAMTGCPGGDEDVELTVLSNKFGNNMLKWKVDGSVEEAVSALILRPLGQHIIDCILSTHLCSVLSAGGPLL